MQQRHRTFIPEKLQISTFILWEKRRAGSEVSFPVRLPPVSSSPWSPDVPFPSEKA